MTQTNRVQVATVRETTTGVTPGSPRTRKLRYTGESLTYSPEFVDSDEIRDDRMNADPILVMRASAGGVNVEMSYPVDDSPLSDLLRSTMFSTWSSTPARDNDGVADSVITDIGTTANTLVCLTGASFVIGHLVRHTGFAQAANNGLFPVTTGGATSYVSTGSGWVAETAPPAAARAKVVGLQGASGDLVAAADGITSTALNFTTLGLQVGQWIDVGGTATAFRFATAANNGWARIVGIAANKLTLDNLPTGWAVDAGTGKTLRIWIGDTIKNGVAKTSLSIEKGFLGQAVPNYLLYQGMVVNTAEVTITSRQKVTASFAFTGMAGAQSTTSVDAVPDDFTTNLVMAANANVGRLAEAGAVLSSPNWARSLTFQVNNNLRTIEAVNAQSPVDVREGECTVTGRVETYFGDATLLSKFYAGTPTSLNTRVEKAGQAMIFAFPRVTYRGDGNPQAGGKNQDVMLPLSWQSSKDPLTGCHVQIDRFEYFEV